MKKYQDSIPDQHRHQKRKNKNNKYKDQKHLYDVSQNNYDNMQ